MQDRERDIDVWHGLLTQRERGEVDDWEKMTFQHVHYHAIECQSMSDAGMRMRSRHGDTYRCYGRIYVHAGEMQQRFKDLKIQKIKTKKIIIFKIKKKKKKRALVGAAEEVHFRKHFTHVTERSTTLRTRQAAYSSYDVIGSTL